MNTNVLYAELSYQIQGAIYDVANNYGKGLKEIIYEKALGEALTKRGLLWERQKQIPIYSSETEKKLGVYIPDIVVEDKIVIEVKATDFTTKQNLQQQLSYLKASKYEVGYLVNFCAQKLYIKRSIYTNDRKSDFIRKKIK